MESLHQIVAAKETVEADLLQRPGVTGVAVGYKYVGGQRTDQVAIVVFVKEKKKNVPKAEMIPAKLHGQPTDVIQRTYVPHPAMKAVLDVELMADTGTYNPVKGGISIGPCRAVGGFVYAGTLGAVVKDNTTGDPLLLSNFHVMCVDNTWSVGDPMVQPSRVDTGSCPGGQVGTLLRAQLTSAVDGAVCTLSGRGSACEIVDIGAINGTATATLNMNARKRGRTTGLTYGKVDSISLSVNLDYGDGIGARTLTNQIGLVPDTSKNAKFGDHGDSGSVVVNDSGAVVGLYFAGSDDGSGVANPIAGVLSALNISLCTTTKSIIKDAKDHKVEIKEVKEAKREKNESKELKIEKREIKEIKQEIKEIKELKAEKVEIFENKPILDNPPKINEGDPFMPPTGPITGPIGQGAIESRVANLEAVVGNLTAFIGSDLRPDLSTGALSQESDLVQKSQKLQQLANDAIAAKTAFDTKQR